MADKTVTGTFSGTGQSETIQGKEVFISLDFAGTATVDIEYNADGTNWVAFSDGNFTADGDKVYEGPSIPIRLNCTAHTNNVTYAMHSTK